MKNKKLKILSLVGNLGAVAQIRIISPLNYLEKKGYIEHRVVDLSEEINNQLDYVPDIVILQRLHSMNYYGFVELLKDKGAKIIFELDDNLLELPKKNPAYNLYTDPVNRRGLLEFIWLADQLTVSTENLKNYYSSFNKNITVIPNQIDEGIFNNKGIKKVNQPVIRIGFAGTTTHYEDFAQVMPALKEIREKYNERIKLIFFSMIPEEFVWDKSVDYISGVGSLRKFAKLLMNANLDIGLAPLVSNKFNMAKSEIKFLEYSISGIAGIYSNFGPYKDAVKGGETGLLVDSENSEEWFKNLSYFIDNPSEIDRIRLNAFNYVSSKRTIKKNYDNWWNALQKLLHENNCQVEGIKLENDYLHPQDIESNQNLKSFNRPVVSIIIPVHNQKKYTKECIESIYKNSELEFELIVIDNNSTDGTREYLKYLKSKFHSVKIIFNEQNLGFPRSINQGIIRSTGDFILIANNDIVVTRNWLNRMIEVAKSDPKIGIVGPISNAVSGVQIDLGAKYLSMKDMRRYAAKVGKKNGGKVEEFPRVAFLCTLINKELIEKIGGLDERFSPGNFEDDDFCLRSQLAGYKTVIAKDVFIHHYGSVSFKHEGNDKYDERLKINEQKFIEKWGSNPEGIWLHGAKLRKRSIHFPINEDEFIQYFERAMEDIEDEENDTALINLKLAIDKYDNSLRKGYEKITQDELMNIAGNLALSKNNLEEAKMYFEKELENNPNSAKACFGLGEIFYIAELYKESKTMLEWAIANDESNKNAKLRLKDVNGKLKLPKEHNSLTEENKVE